MDGQRLGSLACQLQTLTFARVTDGARVWRARFSVHSLEADRVNKGLLRPKPF